MRQIILILAAMLLTCCSSESDAKAERLRVGEQGSGMTTQAAANMGKTLIVYYSYTNKCHEIVTTLSSQIEADVVRIEPAEKGLKYEENNYAIGMQLLNAIKTNPNDASSYPAIDPVNVNLSDYQNIIIVTPLWWSQMAAIMQTYLFNNSTKLAGKTVAMIVSSQSSSISGVVTDAQRLLPNVTWAGDALWINNASHSNRISLIQNWLPTQNFQTSSNMTQLMYITIDGVAKTATLVDNAATQALVAKLQEAPVTVTLNDNNFEIWGALGFSLPSSNEYINAQAGDIVLYSGSNICIFYDSNSYSYTRLGKIDGLSESELRTFLKAGQSSINVTLSLTNTTGISQVRNDENQSKAYTLQGTLAQAGPKGIVIQNGKKIIR